MGFLEDVMKMFRSDDVANRPAGLGRNDECWCGSGKKYKKCHLQEDEQKLRSRCDLGCKTT